MKFAFIAIAAVVVIGSVRVDGDNVDVYPGIPEDSLFSKQDDDYSPLFPDSLDSLPRMRGSFPWTRERKPTKAHAAAVATEDISLMQQLLEDMLERRRQQIKVNAVKNFQYLSPHPEILDDPRPYVADEQDGDADGRDPSDGDFSFLPADDVSVNDLASPYRPEQVYANPYPDNEQINSYGMMNAYGSGLHRDRGTSHELSSHEEHLTHKMHEVEAGPDGGQPEASVFKDIEFVKDPADFAYPPTDPRFFEDRRDAGKTDLNLDDANTNKIYGLINSAPAAYANANSAHMPGNLGANANSDDYGFLTDDDADVAHGDRNRDEDESEDEQVHNFLRDKSISVKNRNDVAAAGGERAQSRESLRNSEDVEVVAMRTDRADAESTGIYILAIIAGVSAAALVTLITLVITWFNLQKNVKNASDAEYPAYGVTGPNKEVSPSGDRRLAQSAQMYHYQHQKQQIIAMERAAATERHGSISEADSDEENEEGDYTVYECPGLAPTGEMEVKNPMFQDDPTPAQTPQQKQSEGATPKK